MKKNWLRFGLLFTCLLACTLVFANGGGADEDVRDVPIRGQSDGPWEEGGIVRGIRMPSIQVALTGSELTINFGTNVQTSSFTVTNLTTGEVVYNENYPTPGTVIIDLTGEEDGVYLLEMRMPYWYFSGEFEL